MKWRLLAGTICLIRSTWRSEARRHQWVLANGYLDFNQWSIISLPPGGHRNQIRPPMSSLLQAFRLCPDGRQRSPAFLSNLVSQRSKTFRPLATWMLSHNPFWGPGCTVEQITSEIIYAHSGLAGASHQPLQCALWTISWLGPWGQGTRPWGADGCAEPFLIHSAIQLQLQVIFKYKQSPKLFRNVFSSLPPVGGREEKMFTFILEFEKLLPASKDQLQGPQHQILLKEGVEPFGTGESLPPSAAVSLRAPDPQRGHPLGE